MKKAYEHGKVELFLVEENKEFDESIKNPENVPGKSGYVQVVTLSEVPAFIRKTAETRPWMYSSDEGFVDDPKDNYFLGIGIQLPNRKQEEYRFATNCIANLFNYQRVLNWVEKVKATGLKLSDEQVLHVNQLEDRSINRGINKIENALTHKRFHYPVILYSDRQKAHATNTLRDFVHIFGLPPEIAMESYRLSAIETALIGRNKPIGVPESDLELIDMQQVREDCKRYRANCFPDFAERRLRHLQSIGDLLVQLEEIK